MKPAPVKRENGKPEFANIQPSPPPISVSHLKGAPSLMINTAPPQPLPFRAKEKLRGRVKGVKAIIMNEWRCLKKSSSPAWDKIIETLAAEIKVRRYSRKTLKAYADWSRKFQSYLRNKTPDALTAADVKAYLTYLAVNCKVAASTQNHAFNALLFLYRHILKKDFGEHKDIPRAKKSNYIPIALSRQEIDSVLKHLSHPYNLIVKLLYGCGLRLFESVKLLVKDFNFDTGILTVRGKDNKSRTVPMPQKITLELTEQLEAVKNFTMLTSRQATRVYFSKINLKRNIRKRQRSLSGSGFFHCATHLLQANYDIRTIQTLLGHSDVRTTMVYTHCVPSKTIKEIKSPLDF